MRARIVDAAGGGVALDVAGPASAALTPGTEATLDLRLAEGPPAQVRVVVRHCRERGGRHRICGVEFLDADALDQGAPPSAWALLNRRRWFRVTVSGHCHVVVRGQGAESGREPAKGRLLVLAGGGCATTVDRPGELAEDHRVSLRFALADLEMDLIGVVRTVVPGGWLGIEFDAAATPRFAAQQQQIARYVMRQETQRLRA